MYYRLFLEGRIWLKTLLLLLPPPHEGLKPRATKGFKGLLKAKALWGLVFALVFTSAALAVAYRCTPCSQNYYCQAGVSYECPPETPVTVSTGASSVNECVTCAQRDGGSYPLYDDVSGQCIACWQVPATTTPYWNGTACAACPNGKTWDSENLTCKEAEAQSACVFEIPHDGGTLCLVESVDYTTFETVTPQSASDETSEFLSTYGITEVSSEYPDFWAGAMKYCQDKGLRLPTMDELHSIMNTVSGTSKTCTTACNNINSQYTGAQTGCCNYYYGLTITNTELWNFLNSGTPSTSIEGSFALWSSAETSNSSAHIRIFTGGGSMFSGNGRNGNTDNTRALCVK